MKLLFLFIFLLYTEADSSYSHRPADLMADLTNDLGVCILQIQAALQPGNIAFSPYGVASMSVLLFEGAAGNTAVEIMKILNLPWNSLLIRIGFRDINRHLKTYFKSDGFLRGLIMSREDVCFHPSYQKLLRLYGFEEPDKALTYPCTGFTPYVTSTTTFSSTTLDTATITSPSSDDETKTTIPTTTNTTTTAQPTDGEENVVTEMTQTSQTVMIVNSTTFQPVEAEAINDAFTSFKTDLPTLLNGSKTTPDPSAKITTRIDDNPSSHQALFSDPTMSFNTDNKMNTKADIISSNSAKPTIIEQAKSTITEETFTGTTPQRNKESETQQTPYSSVSLKTKITMQETQSSTNSPAVQTNSIFSTTEADVIMKNTNNSEQMQIFKTIKTNGNIKNNLSSSNLESKNFTIKLEPDFTPSSNDTLALINTFFNQTKDILEQNSNVTFIGSNTSSTPNALSLNSTFLSNFSSIFPDHSPILDDELNLKNSTTFYSTLVNFIENTTEKIKNLLNVKNSNTTALVNSENRTTSAISSNSSTTKAANDEEIKKMNETRKNFTERVVKLNQDNLLPITLLSGEGNSINANKGVAETNDARNLPKKSISESNQLPKSSAVSISPAMSRKSPNYYNILSLKQSKSISSTYDIKGIKSNKRLLKRQTFPIKGEYLATNLNDKKIQEFVHSKNEEFHKVKSFSNDYWKDNRIIPFNLIQRGSNNRNGSFTEEKFQRLSPTDEQKNNFSAVFTATNNYNMDYRQIRSHKHDYFFPPNTDWFSTNGQNIRVSMFSYSAILPFAYIEDLKAKILEIPLDDDNYRLMILLPAPGNGIDNLINTLTKYPLRMIRYHLQDTAVYATIPKFSVISHINLRHALHRLGMRDVFHRYRADLSVMSPDARLFVNGIEQVVTIHVDKFPNTAYPVPEPLTDRYFLATYPFLYFVIDVESDVSLVAGIMSDPSRQTVRFL